MKLPVAFGAPQLIGEALGGHEIFVAHRQREYSRGSPPWVSSEGSIVAAIRVRGGSHTRSTTPFAEPFIDQLKSSGGLSGAATP
jgi:hypothetical protein